MPPKRKKASAAKKKKSNFSTSSTTSLESDDLKIVEGDEVEISTPVSDENRGDSPVRSYVDEKTPEDVLLNDGDGEKKVVAEDYDGGVVVGAREVNVEEEFESKNGGAEYDESVENGHNRSSSSSSSSSRSRSSLDGEAQAKVELDLEDIESQVVENISLDSKDQSQVVEKNSFELEDESPVVEYISLESEDQVRVVENNSFELEDPEKLKKEEDSNPEVANVPDYVPTQEAEYNSVVETELPAESVKLDEVLLEKVIPLGEIFPLETSVISDVVEFSADVKDDHYTDYAKNGHATDDAKGNHDTDNGPTEEVHYNSVMETEPNVNSVKLDEPILEKVIPITGTNEKDDQLLPSLVESENNFGLVTDIEAEKVVDKAFPLFYENDGGSSSANAPVTGARNVGEDTKHSEFPECSEKQPLLAPPSQQVQKTSWKSCCGLFDW